jgi:putative cell wall-binding protein
MQRRPARALAVAGLTTAALIGGAAVLPPVAQAAPANVTVATANLLWAPSTPDVSVGDITLSEAAAGDVPVGDVCIDIIGAAATWDGATPNVTDGNAAATTGPVSPPTANRAKFTVTAASVGTPTAYVVSGLKVDTTATRGPVTGKVGNCTGNNDQFEPLVKLGWIGELDRIQGADRYATAAQAARTFPCANNNHVVIARGDRFPDALAASFLAGKRNSPILLVRPDTVPQVTLDALKDLGASNVTIVGGELAITPAVATALDNAAAFPSCGLAASGTLNVTRVGGTDRFDTARLVAAAGANLTNPVAGAGTLGVVGNDAVACGGAKKKTAIIVTGEEFADALTAGSLAWAGAPAACGNESALPLLLTRRDSLPSETSAALTSLGIEQALVVGGTAAVSTAVETAIDNVAGVTPVRVAGANRQATAVALANRILGKDGPAGLDWNGGGTRRFLVVRGDDFADALAAGPVGGRETAPLFLTATPGDLGTTSATGIVAYPNADPFQRGTIVGGEAAVTPAAAIQVGVAIANQT